MTVGPPLKSAVVASLELSLRKVRGLLGGTMSDMIVFESVVGVANEIQVVKFLQMANVRSEREKGGWESKVRLV